MPRTAVRVRRPVPDSSALRGLGERLRKARTEAGLTQGQLGAPHFTRAYVSAVELGKIHPSVKSLEFMAAKLSKPTAHFMEEQGTATRDKQVRARTRRAAQLVAEGRSREAIRPLEELLAGSSGRQRAEIQRLLGRAHTDVGEAAAAVAHLNEALAAFLRIGDSENAVRARAQLGVALVLGKSHAEAAVQLEKVLEAFAAGVAKDPLVKLQALHHMGTIFYHRGDFPTALSHFDRALLEGQDVGDPRFLGSAYAASGMSRYQTGDFEGAISCFLKSEAIFESIRKDERVVDIQFQTAIALRRLGNRTKALETAQRAGTRARTLGLTELGIRIQTFAAACTAELGDDSTALEDLERLVIEADQTTNASLRSISRFGLGRVLKAFDMRRAEDVLRDAAAVLEGSEPSSELADVYTELSEVLSRNGDAQGALEYANKALRQLRP